MTNQGLSAGVEQFVPARRQTEGGGFSVRRPIPSPDLDQAGRMGKIAAI